jgi:signal transduction histidine kinase
MIIVYGYYFNSSTEKIIKSNYLEKKARNELKEFSDKLEEKIQEQTRDIREKNAHLEELLSMKSDFLRTVNHQLNTPLTIMKNAFSMIKDKSLPVEKGLEIAGHGLDRMSSTIEDFWSAFELEEQNIPTELKETDLEKIVKSIIEEKKKMEIAITRKLKIRYIKPDFEVPKVLCAEKKIPHVVSNLLDNAVYYTQKGTIKVWFEKIKKGRKEYLKTFISDTGEGIPKEEKEKIYEKFYRGETTSSINPNGSGLGLYIAKNIVEDNNGELRLEKSEVGKGSTFSFTLEVSKPKNRKKDAPKSSPEKRLA